MSISKKLKPCAMLVCTHTKQPKLMFIWLTIKVLTVQEASLEKRETQHPSSWENEEADIREKTKKKKTLQVTLPPSVWLTLIKKPSGTPLLPAFAAKAAGSAQICNQTCLSGPHQPWILTVAAREANRRQGLLVTRMAWAKASCKTH